MGNRVRRALPGLWIAAAVFAVHPVHVESVAWAASRKDLVSTLFLLVALLCYSGLRAIPDAYYRAASIDGASMKKLLQPLPEGAQACMVDTV